MSVSNFGLIPLTNLTALYKFSEDGIQRLFVAFAFWFLSRANPKPRFRVCFVSSRVQKSNLSQEPIHFQQLSRAGVNDFVRTCLFANKNVCNSSGTNGTQPCRTHLPLSPVLNTRRTSQTWRRLLAHFRCQHRSRETRAATPDKQPTSVREAHLHSIQSSSVSVLADRPQPDNRKQLISKETQGKLTFTFKTFHFSLRSNTCQCRKLRARSAARNRPSQPLCLKPLTFTQFSVNNTGQHGRVSISRSSTNGCWTLLSDTTLSPTRHLRSLGLPHRSSRFQL